MRRVFQIGDVALDLSLVSELEKLEITVLNIHLSTLDQSDFNGDDWLLLWNKDATLEVIESLNQKCNAKIIILCKELTNAYKRELKRWQKIGLIKGTIYTPILAEEIIDLITEQLPAQCEVYRKYLDKMNAMAVITNEHQEILYANQRFLDETQYTIDEICNQNPSFLKSGEHSVLYYDNLSHTLNANMVWNGVFRNKRKDGTLFWEDASIFPIDIKGKRYFGKTATNVTRREEMLNEKKQDVKMASDIQKTLLPDSWEDSNVVIQSLYRSLDSVSGDIYYWKQVESGVYAVFLADVVGHGVRSALMTTALVAVVSGLIDSNYEVNEFLKNLNDHVMSLFKSKDLSQINYFTAVYMVVDTQREEVCIANCGHPSIYYMDTEGIQAVSERNFPIGLFSDVAFNSKRIQIKKQSKMVLYTDGLIEFDSLQRDHQAELKDHLHEYLNKGMQLSLAQYLEKTYLKTYEALIKDDITVIEMDLL